MFENITDEELLVLKSNSAKIWAWFASKNKTTDAIKEFKRLSKINTEIEKRKLK